MDGCLARDPAVGGKGVRRTLRASRSTTCGILVGLAALDPSQDDEFRVPIVDD